ncbi:MAG: hypothetical protein Q8R29_03825 [bacterium]|nr:hypothetical protein [bacterium]
MYFSKQAKTSFYPKKPLRSFQDLEVYQKTLEISVLIAKKVKSLAPEIDRDFSSKSQPKLQSRQGTDATSVSIIGTGLFIDEIILKNMLPCVLGIPHLIAEAHSQRFGDHTAGIAALEKAMLNCNKAIVYIEQFRDICDTKIEHEFFEDLIKRYTFIRRKMLNLERSWKKFMPQN